MKYLSKFWAGLTLFRTIIALGGIQISVIACLNKWAYCHEQQTYEVSEYGIHNFKNSKKSDSVILSFSILRLSLTHEYPIL